MVTPLLTLHQEHTVLDKGVVMSIDLQLENKALLVWQTPEIKEMCLNFTLGGNTNNSENDTGMWS